MKAIIIAAILLTSSPIESAYIMASVETENIVVAELGLLWIEDCEQHD